MECHGCGESAAHQTYGTDWCQTCFQGRLAASTAVLLEHGCDLLVANALDEIGIRTVGALGRCQPAELLDRMSGVQAKRLDGLLSAFRKFMQGLPPSEVVTPAVPARPAKNGKPATVAQPALTKSDIDARRAEVDAERQRNPARVSCEPRTRDVYGRPHNTREYDGDLRQR